MISMDELHEQAMDLSDQALVSKHRGNVDVATELYRRAFHLEARAADLVEADLSAEPTRSVLYRSAAAMAMDAGELDEARRLIGKALSGHPPKEIELELLELLDAITFRRHLELRDVTLQPGELQFSIAGNEVGAGVTLTDVFVDRIKDFEKLVFRTVERKLGLPFRKAGSARRSVLQGYSLYMSAPRTGSFAVTLRLGRQLQLPGFDISDDVIDELLHGVALVNESQEDKLEELIPDPTYRENFVALVRQIAPDGEKVSLVGLTAGRNGQEVQVAVTRNRQTISLVSSSEAASISKGTQEQSRNFTGRLLFADARKDKGRIQLIADDGNKYTVIVPEGMMTDIVKPLWDDVVTVIGVPKGKSIYLQDIHPA